MDQEDKLLDLMLLVELELALQELPGYGGVKDRISRVIAVLKARSGSEE